MPVTRNGTHYEEQGSGEHTVVLIPGFGCSIACWADIAPRLDARVVMIDLPGHAGSVRAPADGDLRHLAATVLDACRELGLGRFVVGGMSLGGAVALRLALDSPDEVTGVMGVMPWNAGGTTEAEGDGIKAFHDMYGDPDGMRAGVEAISQLPEKTTDLVRTMPTVTEQMWRGWLGGGAYTNMTDELPGLRVPLLYVVGGQDDVVDLHKQVEDVRAVPDGRLVMLGDAGHLAAYEIPETVAFEMSQFLNRHVPAAS